MTPQQKKWAAVAARQEARAERRSIDLDHKRVADLRRERARQRNADRIDGYDCDDLGESPDY